MFSYRNIHFKNRELPNFKVWFQQDGGGNVFNHFFYLIFAYLTVHPWLTPKGKNIVWFLSTNIVFSADKRFDGTFHKNIVYSCSTNNVFSADERFDGTFQTNIVVSSDGSMLYVPPGIFKSTCKVATLIVCFFGKYFVEIIFSFFGGK